MPELPEVETVCRQLDPILSKRQLIAIEVFDSKLKHIKHPRGKAFRVKRVFRVGKQVVVELRDFKEKELFFVIHLRMTGRLIWFEGGEAVVTDSSYVNKSSAILPRVNFVFKKGELGFYDTRRFGTIESFKKDSDIVEKGIDPMSDDFSFEVFQEMILDSKQAMKNFLMRQDKISGIGNIYASEILFRSKINPKRLTSELSSKEIKLLYKNIIYILNKAVKNCGTTFSDFQDTTGSTGKYQRFLKVYAREGEKCSRCTEKIKRISQQQRSTFFCEGCQV